MESCWALRAKHTQPAKNNSGVMLYIQNRCVYVETHYYFIMALMVLKVSYKRYSLLNGLINPAALKQ